LRTEFETITERVPANATLDGLLRGHALSPVPVQAAVAAAAAVFDPRHLRAGQPYRLVRSLDGLLREFELEVDADRILRIVCPDRLKPAALESSVIPIEKKRSVTAISATIDSAAPSLISAVAEAGEAIQLALALAEIFSGSIDFDSDLQPGDGFEAIFEKSTREGGPAGYGSILGARFVADGREHYAFRWTDPATGKSSYYDENGRSLKRFFLKSPLRFEPRITSGFSRHRLHPVHRTYRPHLGVDYGAPYGSAVVAVSSGVVVSAGWAGGGGKQVRIRHSSGFESYYLHLSAFGKGVRAGAHVDQGQVIGRVGATGTATGPHLDYRLRRNGVFVNPRVEHARLPPGEPIASSDLAAFRAGRDDLRQRMSTLIVDAARRKPDAVKAIQ
jgi:murein DD-endopeptidase MepM/ murein hydrolase activator NlpD